ncbi:MAG TPA: hypothetical protein VFN97_21845 [Actinospica sp.]|nr:hypothetical protein [Actinospica sp.]
MPEEEPESLEDEPEFELELDPELVPLLAVGVDDEELSVPEEPPELFDVAELDVEVVPEDELLVCVALGTVAATAREPAIPLAATIAVIVAVRALPCRTDRAAPSASMAQLRQGKLSFRDP